MKTKNTLIIAEAGVNHNGSLERALELVRIAAKSGADIVKFQTFIASDIVTPSAEKAEYQKLNDPATGHSQYEMIKSLELSRPHHFVLKEAAAELGIDFLSTAFGVSDLQFLIKDLGMKRIKIASGEITHKRYLEAVAGYRLPTILSTGMCTLPEVRAAVDLLFKNGLNADLLTLLHCVSEYPAPLGTINLHAMLQLKSEFGCEVGYSDHSLGSEACLAAVTLGATVIEKHFTWSKKAEGPDHLASMESEELSQLVQSIRRTELLCAGSGIKTPSAIEKETALRVRRGLVADRSIQRGEVFTENLLRAKRPEGQVSAWRIDDLIGKVSLNHYKADDPILSVELSEEK